MENEWFDINTIINTIQSNQLIYSITIDSLLSIIDSLTCVLKRTWKPLHLGMIQLILTYRGTRAIYSNYASTATTK